jgi:hypothetical protein
MTAITLPLKKIPGQNLKLPTFFGGRKTTAPMVLLLTLPFNIYFLIHLARGTVIIYNLIGLIPYLHGLALIAYSIKESDRAMNKIIESDLHNAERIFENSKTNFRKLFVSNCFFSVIMMTVFSYLLLAHGMVPLFIIGVSSIKSVGIAISAIISRYEMKNILIFSFIALTIETTFTILLLNNQWKLSPTLPLASIIIVYLSLRFLKEYELRSFFERLIN